MEDRTTFLNEGPRAAIARLCRTAPRTRQELADELKRPRGGLSSVDTMLKHGALVDAGARGRAQMVQLDSDWGEALDRLGADPSDAGLLVENNDLILVQAGDVARVSGLMHSGLTDVRWGVPLAGEQMGLMLSTAPDARGASALRVLDELQRANVTAIRLRLGEPLARPELREWAAQVSPPNHLGAG